jgi:Carboxypeptidase regulatory-like domain
MNSLLKMARTARTIRVLAAVLGVFLFCLSLFSQVNTGTISGIVQDSSGAVVAGATVTIRNVDTGTARTVTSDEGGRYIAPVLPLGNYELQAQQSGFQTEIRTGITLTVGRDEVINLTLRVGQQTQSVTVSEQAPLVNTTTSEIAGLVGEREVKDLPLNGRSFDNLITLNPGAINYSSLKSGPSVGSGEGAYFTVAGRRPLDNLFLLNGIEYTGSSNIGITPGGVSGQLLGIDAVREFNVLSDAYSAEYGKRAGAQVSVVTQSGTNSLHGSVFEFLRNSALDARNFFDYPLEGRIPPFKRNQFGGSLGGPIKKDKAFLFGSYEGFRQRLGLSNVAIVPDAGARQGFLPCNVVSSQNLRANVNDPSTNLPFNYKYTKPACTGSQLVDVKGDPTLLKFAQNLWPAPNGPEQLVNGLPTGTAQNFNSPLQKIREDFGTVRFDENISTKDTFTAAATGDDGYNLSPLTNPLFGTVARLRSQVDSLQETHAFSPQLINTLRGGFSRAAFWYDSPALDPTLPPNLTLFAGRPSGPIAIGGASAAAVNSFTPAGGGISGNIWNNRNLFTGSDDVQLIHGKHQMSFGLWAQRIQVNANSAGRGNGEADFTGLQTFLEGITSNFVGVPNKTVMYWRAWVGAWYVQDVVKLRPNLTLRAGIRHEFTDGFNEKYGRASNYVPDANGVPTSDTQNSATHIGTSPFTQNNATKLFSPRIGLAWDPFGNGKTSIRAGFGMYYTLLDDLNFQLDFNAPNNSQFQYRNVPLSRYLPVFPGNSLKPFCGPGLAPPVLAPAVSCTPLTPWGTQVDPKTPTAVEWNLSVERQVAQNMSIRVGYLGSHAYHNVIDIDANAVFPQICSSPTCASGGAQGTGVVQQGTQYFPAFSPAPGGQPNPRPNPFLGSAYFWYTEGVASYNALQFDLTRRISSGLTFRGNYTFSKNLDDGSGIASSQSQNNNQSVMDPRDPLRDYGRSALDFRHQGSGTFSYELPFGNGKRFANGLSGGANRLAGGWQVNGILTLLSGFPFTPLVGYNQSGNGNQFSPDRPNWNPNFQGPVKVGRPDQWYNPNAFSLPTVGTWGNVGRGVMDGPGLAELDFSVFKTIPIEERTSVVFRAEFFNITNRTNFGLPNPNVFSGSSISPSAGLIVATTGTSRQIQLGLKLMF